LRAETGLVPGPVNYRDLDRAIKALYAIGQFEDVRATCELAAGGQGAMLVFTLRERPLLGAVDVKGTDRLSVNSVRDRVDLLIGRPLDPAQVARAVQRIDSLYQAAGYYLARVTPETTFVEGKVSLIFRVDEGHRLAVSGVDIQGNQGVSDKSVVGAMSTRPEGFFWWKKGEFDEDKFASDITEKIPQLYAKHGFIDAQITQDTMIVDRERGKALLDITVNEGAQYRVGSFEVLGASRFPRDVIQGFFPFGERTRTLSGTVKGVLRLGDAEEEGVFDESAWDDATRKLQSAYATEGYIYARIQPVVERRFLGKDSVPTVNLRWEIQEGLPAIVNRVEIVGNDITNESCIRDQILMLPGDVFNQEFSFAYLVDHIREFMDALGIEKTNMAGHSMGGWIATLMGYESPDRINKLVLVAAGGTATRPLQNMVEFKVPTTEQINAQIGPRAKIADEIGMDFGDPATEEGRKNIEKEVGRLLRWHEMYPNLCAEAIELAGKWKLPFGRAVRLSKMSKVDQKARLEGHRVPQAKKPARPLSPRVATIFASQIAELKKAPTDFLLGFRLALGDRSAAKELPEHLRAAWLKTQEEAAKKPRRSA